MVRSVGAGVFFGEVVEQNLSERWCIIKNARRVWYWEGAASISQLAQLGTSLPHACKFPVAVDSITVLDVCEILDVTKHAKVSLESVPVWRC